MCKFNPKNEGRRIDPCMDNLIKGINGVLDCYAFEIMGCCCGHGKYPMTIVIWGTHGRIFDLVSGKDIPRKTRFYKRDKQGVYYIPECVNGKLEELK